MLKYSEGLLILLDILCPAREYAVISFPVLLPAIEMDPLWQESVWYLILQSISVLKQYY